MNIISKDTLWTIHCYRVMWYDEDWGLTRFWNLLRGCAGRKGGVEAYDQSTGGAGICWPTVSFGNRIESHHSKHPNWPRPLRQSPSLLLCWITEICGRFSAARLPVFPPKPFWRSRRPRFGAAEQFSDYPSRNKTEGQGSAGPCPSAFCLDNHGSLLSLIRWV